MSSQMGDCFKFLWPFQNVRTLSTYVDFCTVPVEQFGKFSNHRNCGDFKNLPGDLKDPIVNLDNEMR